MIRREPCAATYPAAICPLARTLSRYLQKTYSNVLTRGDAAFTLQATCKRVMRGLLSGVTDNGQTETSDAEREAKREAALLPTPPIHPRVSSVAVASTRLLISRAGRDGDIRFA